MLEASSLDAWVIVAAERLSEVAPRIDALNLIPVPDRDTGQNVAVTVAAAAAEIGARPGQDAADSATRIAAAAQAHARGSSGVIIAGWLAGVAAAVTSAGPGPGPTISRVLTAAAAAARATVADPWPGTVLEVADQVAQGVADQVRQGAADPGVPAPDGTLLVAAVRSACDRLTPTSAHHPALAAAGVVDAGACALLVLLEVLAAVLDGRPADHVGAWIPVGTSPMHPSPPAGGAFEVLLDTAARPQTSAMSADAVVVTGAADRWTCHLHTDDPAAVIVAAADARLRSAVVRTVAPPPSGVAVVTDDPGLAAWFAVTGASVFVVTDTDDGTADRIAAESPRMVVATADGLVDGLSPTCTDPVSAAVAVTADPNQVAVALARLQVAAVVTGDPWPRVVALTGARPAGSAPGETLTVVPRNDQDTAALAAHAAQVGLELVVVGPATTGPAWWVGTD